MAENTRDYNVDNDPLNKSTGDAFILKYINKFKRDAEARQANEAQDSRRKDWRRLFFTTQNSSASLHAEANGVASVVSAVRSSSNETRQANIRKLLKLFPPNSEDGSGGDLRRNSSLKDGSGVSAPTTPKKRKSKTPRKRNPVHSPKYSNWRRRPVDDTPPSVPDIDPMTVFGPNAVHVLDMNTAYIPHKEVGPRADQVVVPEDLHRHSVRIRRELERGRARSHVERRIASYHSPSTDRAALKHGRSVRDSAVPARRYYTGFESEDGYTPVQSEHGSPHSDVAIDAWLSRIPKPSPRAQRLRERDRSYSQSLSREGSLSSRGVLSREGSTLRGEKSGSYSALFGDDPFTGDGAGGDAGRYDGPAAGARIASAGPERPLSPRNSRWLARQKGEWTPDSQTNRLKSYESELGLRPSSTSEVAGGRWGASTNLRRMSSTPSETGQKKLPSPQPSTENSLLAMAAGMPLHVLEARVIEKRSLRAKKVQDALMRRQEEDIAPRPPLPTWRGPSFSSRIQIAIPVNTPP